MIYVPEKVKNILVSHSSGMDSTLLIFKLLEELQRINKIHDVNIYVNTGFEPIADPHAPNRSDKICKILFDKFNCKYKRLSFEYKDGETKIPTFRKNVRAFKSKYNIDTYYRGTTLGPPVDIQLKYNYHKPERDENKLTHIKIVDNIHTIVPWFNKNKKFIVDEWKKSDFLMNEVYHLTFSCVCGKDETESWTKHCYDLHEKPQKWCWWCVEKKWAFGELSE